MQEGVVKDITISLSRGLLVLPHVPLLWQYCGLVHLLCLGQLVTTMSTPFISPTVYLINKYFVMYVSIEMGQLTPARFKT